MMATPIICPHGLTVSWNVVDALPMDPMPEAAHCAACWPDDVVTELDPP